MKKINLDEFFKNVQTNTGFVDGSPVITNVMKKLKEENQEHPDLEEENTEINKDNSVDTLNDTETNEQTENIAEETTSNEEKETSTNNNNTEVIKITNATLLNVTVNNANETKIATLTWLCAVGKAIFILYTNYLIEDETNDLEFIENLNINDQKQFIGIQIGTRILFSTLPCFLTDFNFYTGRGEISSETTSFFIDAVKSTDNGVAEKVIFEANNDLFNAFKFVDNYIIDHVTNPYNLGLAVDTAGAAKEDTSIFIVDNIDSIISMASLTKKSSDIAVIFKAYHYLDKDKKDAVSILSTFNLGTTFPKTKFKKCSFEKIQETFLVDADQYMTNLISLSNFKDVDKDYMILRATNKNKETKLFLLDRGVQTQLETLIQDY